MPKKRRYMHRRRVFIMKTKAQVKPMPSFRSDDEAEKFVSTADLSQYDLSEFKSMRFEVEAKSAALNMRLTFVVLGGLWRHRALGLG